MNLDNPFSEFELKIENHLACVYRGGAGFGAPLPRGVLRAGEPLHLRDRAGKSYPLAWRALTFEDDGSVGWAYFSFPVVLRRREFKHFTLHCGAVEFDGLRWEQKESGLEVRNGGETLVFSSDAPLGLRALERDGRVVLRGANAVFGCEEGQYTLRAPLEISLRHANETQVTVCAQGELKGQQEGDAIWFRLLYTIRSGQNGVDINAAFSNRRAGDDELHLQRFDVKFELAAPIETSLVRQTYEDNLGRPRDYRLSGGVTIENNCLLDAERLELPDSSELYPFFKRVGREAYFSQLDPFVGLQTANGGVVTSWERSLLLETGNLRAQDREVTLELVAPVEDGRRIPQGFSRSFDFSIATCGEPLDSETVFELATVAENPPLVSVHPRWFIACDADEMARVLPFAPEKYPRFERLLWREFAKDYFGGFYHTGDYPSKRGPLETRALAASWTWNNNEEDQLKGIAWMLMRTGDPAYAVDLKLCARHLMEVDRVAHSKHPLLDGIFIAHAPNHFDGTGYPSHCWAEGLLLYYKLSGDQDAKTAFFELCQCLLRWVETPERTRFLDAREIGVSITNFAHAYVLSKDPKYLEAARVYISHFQKQMREEGGLYYQFGNQYGRYSEYVAVEGLWDFYELVGGEDVKTLLIDVIEWIAKTGLDFTGVYDGRMTSESFLQVFYIIYTLTGDESWLEKGRVGFEVALGQPTEEHPLMKFGNNAAFFNEAFKRGWLRDELVPLSVNMNPRASYRPYEYSVPAFVWEKEGIAYDD